MLIPNFRGLKLSKLLRGIVVGIVASSTAMPCFAQHPGDAPLYSGNTSIARDLIAGDTRLLIVGDSLQNRQIDANLNRWDVHALAGVNFPAGSNQVSSTFTSFSHSWLEDSRVHTPDSLTSDDNFGGTTAGQSIKIEFSDGVVPADSGLLANRIASISFPPFALRGGRAWQSQNNGSLYLDVQTYAGLSAPSGGVIADVVVDGQLVVSSLLDIGSEPDRYTNHSITIPTSGLELADHKITVRFRMPSATSVSQGQSFLITNARLTTNTNGFEVSSIHRGGQGLPYFTDRLLISDAAIESHLQATKANTTLIWLGQNDKRFSKLDWKSMMLDLMNRFENSKPDMNFILVSTYDTGGNLDHFADALHEISIAREDTLFLNLYAKAGDYDFLNRHYLTDGVHQGVEGADYLADELWELVESAAVPEPGSILLVMVGVAGILIRRRTTRNEHDA